MSEVNKSILKNAAMEFYSADIHNLITTVKSDEDVNVEFIDYARADGKCTIDAANSWYNEFDIRFVLITRINGVLDYDVKNHPLLTRIVIPKDVQINDLINMHYGENHVGGLIWRGDLVTSVKYADFVVDAYFISYNDNIEKYIISHDEIGTLSEEFEELQDAIEHCKKG